MQDGGRRPPGLLHSAPSLAMVPFERDKDRGVTKSVPVGATTPSIRLTAVEVDHGRFNDLCLDEVVIRGYCD